MVRELKKRPILEALGSLFANFRRGQSVFVAAPIFPVPVLAMPPPNNEQHPSNAH
jgi:hypothetical protein